MQVHNTVKAVATAKLSTNDLIQSEATSTLPMHSIHKIYQISIVLASLCQTK